MSSEQPPTFGVLLKRYRVAAGLSQEALAERAGLTAQGIGAQERGLRQTPHRDTVNMLADALGLAPEERRALEATVRRRHGPRTASDQPATGMALTLPVVRAPLIGREREEAEIARVLPLEETRLLTLTGPGGVGKTHLAGHVAAGLVHLFPGGVVFVALAPVDDAGLVQVTIARALGLQESGERPLHESLTEYLRELRLLLVLDNFEHVIAAAPCVATLLGACRHLKVLATSRAPLGLRDEQEIVVPPLALPDSARLSDLAAVARSPAVVLFTQRSRAVKADFALVDSNAPAVAGICRRLDGLPLALELAAPWIKLLPPPALLTRLERRLPLLTSTAPDLPPRHQTLRATIAWSYDLLDADEQRLFRRMTIFAGGCALEAADAVCMDADNPDTANGAERGAMALLQGLASLVNKSLLRQEELVDPHTGTAEPRLLMLETVREFGEECLAATGELEALRRRHATFFLALAEEAAPRLRGPRQRAWRERLDLEHDNLRAALRWTLESREHELGLRLAGALWHFWVTRGHLSEGRRWLEKLLARPESGEPAVSAALRARALLWASTCAAEQGDYEHAVALCEESDGLSRGIGDTWSLAWSLNVRGELARHRGDHQGAIALFEQSLALFRGLDDRWYVAMLLNNLGTLARYQADDARATALYEESLAMTREIGDTWSTAMILGNLGEVARDQGDTRRAVALCEESLGLCRALGDQSGMAYALNYLGVVARERGEYERALALYAESLALWRHVGQRSEIATCLEGLAEAACALGHATLAARLLGAAAALRERIGAPVPPADRPDYERTVTSVQSALEYAFLPAWEVGQALPLDQVVNEALTLASAAGSVPLGPR
jgi:predicted ATPase/DNA-binding XRE family transcriptional regulator